MASLFLLIVVMCVLKFGDFSNVEWLSGSFHRVTFLRCNLTGTNFADSYLKDCLFGGLQKPIMLLFVLQILILFTLIRPRLVESEFFEVTWKKLPRSLRFNRKYWLNTF